MRRFSLLIAAAAIVGFAGSASAEQPANPGCFGQDRATIIQDVFIADDNEPGASEWGAIAAERGATNGGQNRAYKEGCGGNPEQGAPEVETLSLPD